MTNFGKIKNAFNSILVEGMIKKDDSKKLLFKNYLKTLKENEILKTQFLVFSNIENKIEPNEYRATEFVKENLALFNKFNRLDIIQANFKLCESIVLEETEYGNHELHDNLTKLIFEVKTPTNIDYILEAQNFVVNYIMNNKAKEVNEKIDLPMSMVSSVFVDKYNEKYGSLSESDREILKTILDSTEEEKKIVYSKTIRECIDLIDIKLKDSDLEAKDKLLKVKDKLLNDKQEITENFISNISKLVELRSSLID